MAKIPEYLVNGIYLTSFFIARLFRLLGYRGIGYFEITLDGIVNEVGMLTPKQEEFSD
jgi:hypothetical protein